MPNPSKQKAPTWFKWLMLGFIAYAFFMHWSKTPPNLPPDTAAPANPASEKEGVDLPDSAEVEGFLDKVFPGSIMGIQARDVAEGEGAPAVCGQTVRIYYDAFLKDDNKIDSNRPAATPLQFTLGRGGVMPALEKASLGMKKGGKRVMYSPADWAYGAPGFAKENVPAQTRVKFEVELVEVSPPLPESAMGLRVFDRTVGVGEPAACGDKIKAHVAVWSAAGKKLFEPSSLAASARQAAEPITFTLGGGQVFYGLEQGTFGLREGGRRSLIVPPELTGVFNPNGALPAVTGLDSVKGQAVIVDIERVAE